MNRRQLGCNIWITFLSKLFRNYMPALFDIVKNGFLNCNDLSVWPRRAQMTLFMSIFSQFSSAFDLQLVRVSPAGMILFCFRCFMERPWAFWGIQGSSGYQRTWYQGLILLALPLQAESHTFQAHKHLVHKMKLVTLSLQEEEWLDLEWHVLLVGTVYGWSVPALYMGFCQQLKNEMHDSIWINMTLGHVNIASVTLFLPYFDM